VDGGTTYTKQPVNAQLGSNAVHEVGAKPGVHTLHDFGNLSAHHPVPAGGVTRATAPGAIYWTLQTAAAAAAAGSGPVGRSIRAETGPATPTLSVKTKSTPIVFQGFPVPLQCDKGYGTCPIRLQGSGSVLAGDGTMLQSAIVYYGGSATAPEATSIVCLRSVDGLTWTYVGTIANATDYPASNEGPNGPSSFCYFSLLCSAFGVLDVPVHLCVRVFARRVFRFYFCSLSSSLLFTVPNSMHDREVAVRTPDRAVELSAEFLHPVRRPHKRAHLVELRFLSTSLGFALQSMIWRKLTSVLLWQW
jgi:hypothetical protein